MENVNNTKRQSNVELLRIVAMILIIAHHYACHGGAYYSGVTGCNNWIATFLMAGGKLGVDLFVMITGYFMIESSFKMIRIVRLELAVLFYSIGFYLIACLVVKGEEINFLTIKNAFFPSLTNLGSEYWFIPCYFGIMLISPFLNRLISTLDSRQYALLLGILLLFISVVPTIFQSVPWFDGNMSIFILMYLLGAYMRCEKALLWKHKNAGNLLTSIVLYAAITGMTVMVRNHTDFFAEFGITADPIWSLNSFFVIVLAIFLFQFFLQLKVRTNKLINHISKTTIGIYLIHDNLYVRQYMWTNLLHTDWYYDTKWLPVHALCCILIIFVAGAIIESIREFVMHPLVRKLNGCRGIQRMREQNET